MPKDTGWIKLHRKIQETDGYFNEPFCRNMAWVDMLLLANHDENFFRVRGIRVSIKRGQIGFTSEKLASRWRWSRGKVLRFLKELQIDGQIVQQKNNVITLISIVNYSYYQDSGTANRTANNTTDSTTNGQQTVQQTDINKNDNNYKNDKEDNRGTGDFAPPAAPQQAIAVFRAPDGSLVKEATIQFTANDFNGLPDIYAMSIINSIKSIKNIEVEKERIVTTWESFKITEMHKKLYRSREDVYSFFSNFCKKQVWKSDKSPPKKESKPKGKVIGVEFINDFTQCKMSDGSIQNLEINQKDLAKYNQISPKDISKH